MFFMNTGNKVIYSTMIKMYDSGLPIDIITLKEALKKEGKLEASGGNEYLLKLLMNISTAANIEYHSKIICEQYTKRKMLLAADNIKKEN